MSVKENQLTAFGVLLMAGLVIAAAILGNSMVTFKKLDEQKISVTGAASKMIKSDLATWRGRVTCRSSDRSTAYKQLREHIARVHDYLVKHGADGKTIEESSIETNTLYTRDHNGGYTNTIEGFELTQTLKVSSNDVVKVEQLAKDSNELLTQGISFTSDPPEYFYTRLDSLKVQMLAQATEDAKKRAQSMASSTGYQIGFLKSAQMGVFQITSPTSTDVSSEGIMDTQSIDKKIMAVVNVSFEIR